MPDSNASYAAAESAQYDFSHSLLEECEHLLASQLLSQNRLLDGVHSVKLENVFRRIHTNSANLFHGRPPLSEIYSDLILAPLMPSGAVHINRWRLAGTGIREMSVKTFGFKCTDPDRSQRQGYRRPRKAARPAAN
jgi:hypothetical protein